MLHVVGNVAIDTIFRVDRFPLPGETIVATAMVEDIGGKGANQAVVAARTGVPVRLIAAVGDDEAAQRIRAALAIEGVIVDGLRIESGPTDRSSIYVDATGENTIVSLVGAAQAFDPLASGALDGLAGDDTVLCQGNLRRDVLVSCLARARQAGATCVLNPSPVFPSAGFDWGLVDLLVLNRVEGRQITGLDDPRQAARRLSAAGAGAVVVTLGRDGAIMVADEERVVSAPSVAAIDTTGAGDAFCAMLVAMRLKGLPWTDALALAAEAAAIVVTRRGVLAAFPAGDEIQAMVKNRTRRGEE
jgi:ribokinase